MKKQETIAVSMLWKTFERYSVLGSQLLVQIVIARVISPDEYGLISMMTVFISIATIFIQNGFNMALVQKKDSTDIDCSTAFFINLAIGMVLYLILFATAPLIAGYYHEPQITQCLRVLGLILLIGSITSIQTAIATRNMQFRTLFIGNLSGSVVSGAVGIAAAIMGFGVWALVIQQLTNKLVVTMVMLVLLKWKPQLIVDKASAKTMFVFGWKLLAAGMINQIYNEMNNLVIGRKYTSNDLAFYNKGKQFPNYVTTGIDGSIQSVMFSAFSKKQSDIKAIHDMLRKSISVNTYIIFPLMVGLALVAEPFTAVVLTEKWLPIVPYMQICCLTFALHPIETAHLQALAAIGRSDIRLKLEFVKKPIGILLLILSISHGPFAIALSAMITSVISFIVDIAASRICIKLSFKEQIKDLLPCVLLTAVMGVVVYFVKYLPFSNLVMLCVQVSMGCIVYIGASAIIKPVGYRYMLQFVKQKSV